MKKTNQYIPVYVDKRLFSTKLLELLRWTLAGIAFTVFVALYALWHIIDQQSAVPGKIYIKSELTQKQIKSLGVTHAN